MYSELIKNQTNKKQPAAPNSIDKNKHNKSKQKGAEPPSGQILELSIEKLNTPQFYTYLK